MNAKQIRPIVMLVLVLGMVGIVTSVALAASPIFVRPDGDDTNCDGTTNVDYPGSSGPGLACAVKTIQKGIDLVNVGGTVIVGAGAYTENITVTKTVDIRGPNYGISPNGGTRVAEAIVVPATDDITAGVVFSVAVSNVSINGFTIDGDNMLLTSGYSSTTSADINAAEGVAVYVDNVNNLTVSKNIIQNLSFFGVTLSGAPGSEQATTGHLVHDNFFKDLGTYAPGSGIANWGGGVLLKKNQYARVTNNVMNNVRIGVQTDHFNRANPGAATYQVIDGNAMSVRRRGIFQHEHFSSASPYTLSNNTISALADANETAWEGILLASLTGGYSAVAANNTIDGSAVNNPSEGYEVWQVDFPAAISGGSVRGVSTGVFVNNVEDYSGYKAEGAHAIVGSIHITPTANGVGIHVLDSPSSSHNSISVTVEDDCEIVQSGQTGAGIRVEGGSAIASVLDNDASIHGFAIGIDVNGGSAGITNDNIYDNGIGVRVTNAGAVGVSGNTIHANGTGVLVENSGTAFLTCNNIAGNTTFGVNNTTASVVTAEGNWWGSATGPTHPSNPTGTGDAVSNNVDYSPWTLAAAPGGCSSLSYESVAGYFYLAANGEIVPGGSVAVASPAVVASSGVSGAYHWLTDGTAGTYAMSVTPPTGYALSTGCPAQTGPYTPVGTNPIFLGASEVGNTGVLSDSACAANPYYLSFTLGASPLGASPFVYNNNLPLQGTGAIAGLIWNDIVTDSVQTPPEPPLANVEVQVYGAGLDNTLRTSDDLVYTATTNASGIYTVANLAPDQYLIRLEGLSLPVGFEPRNGYEITVTLGAGQVLPNENFPLEYLGKAQIGNYVWDDLNGDGDLAGDPSEAEFFAGLDGVTLSLYLNPDNSGTFDPNTDLLLDVTTTGDDPTTGGVQKGWYQFLAAADGALTFWVVVDASNFQPGGALADYIQTYPVPSDNTSLVIGLTLQGTDNFVDFAYTNTQARIGDLVWYDTNGDGVRNPGEPGIPGVGLNLGLPSGGISTTATSASGLYTFSNLLPGTYTVTVVSGLPPGAVNTVGPDSKLSPYTLTLTSGQVVTTADFGFDVPTGGTGTGTQLFLPAIAR